MEDFVYQVGYDLDSMRPATQPFVKETDADQLVLLLGDGLPLLHAQATYIRSLESEVRVLVSKLAYFTDLDEKYKADLGALTDKYERILYSSSLPSADTDNPLSFNDQLVSLH